MGRSSKKKLEDFMRGQEIRRQKEIQERNQATIDFIKTHSKLAQKNEDYPLTEKVLELKNCPSIDTTDFPDGLVIPEMWIWEFGLNDN